MSAIDDLCIWPALIIVLSVANALMRYINYYYYYSLAIASYISKYVHLYVFMINIRKHSIHSDICLLIKYHDGTC